MAIIPLLIMVQFANAQSQTPKTCINQELKNAITYAILLQSTGNANDINQTFYDVGTNVIMKCMVK